MTSLFLIVNVVVVGSLVVMCGSSQVVAFQTQQQPPPTARQRTATLEPLFSQASNSRRRRRQTLMVKERSVFDPLELSVQDHPLEFSLLSSKKDASLLPQPTTTTTRTRNTRSSTTTTTGTAAASAAAAFAAAFTFDHHQQAAAAAAAVVMDLQSFKTGVTVENFQPVCSASDGFYRVLQQGVAATVGPAKFSEYGPLIAGGLLRVRLELCVVESFFNEAVGPFIRDNGLFWILPLHETVETFLAGAIFALATTFILIGSTKLLTVIVTYTDFLVGFPARLLGGFAFDRAQGKPVTLDIGVGPFKTRVIGPPKESETNGASFNFKDASAPALIVLLISGAINYFGQALRLVRELLEAVDSFVGRYLVLWASAYLIIKFVHFKIFPDFP